MGRGGGENLLYIPELKTYSQIDELQFQLDQEFITTSVIRKASDLQLRSQVALRLNFWVEKWEQLTPQQQQQLIKACEQSFSHSLFFQISDRTRERDSVHQVLSNLAKFIINQPQRFANPTALYSQVLYSNLTVEEGKTRLNFQSLYDSYNPCLQVTALIKPINNRAKHYHILNDNAQRSCDNKRFNDRNFRVVSECSVAEFSLCPQCVAKFDDNLYTTTLEPVVFKKLILTSLANYALANRKQFTDVKDFQQQTLTGWMKMRLPQLTDQERETVVENLYKANAPRLRLDKTSSVELLTDDEIKAHSILRNLY